MLCLRASATMRCCAASPASSISAKPAVNITAAFTPRSASSVIDFSAISAAIATMATSGVSGSAATEGYAFSPCTSARFGLIGYSAP